MDATIAFSGLNKDSWGKQNFDQATIAKVYNHLENLFRNQSNFIEALKYYRESFGIYQKPLPSKHNDVMKAKENVLVTTVKLKK